MSTKGVRCTCNGRLVGTLLGCKCVACGLTYEVADDAKRVLWCPREKRRLVVGPTGRLVPEVSE